MRDAFNLTRNIDAKIKTNQIKILKDDEVTPLLVHDDDLSLPTR